LGPIPALGPKKKYSPGSLLGLKVPRSEQAKRGVLMLAPPPKSRNAKAARWQGGLAETIQEIKPLPSSATGFDLQVPRLESSPHIDLDTLEEMSFWRLSLTRRIRRALLRFEYADTEIADLHDLAREVRDFKACCRALAWRPGRAA
jgi:hypothetical protein